MDTHSHTTIQERPPFNSSAQILDSYIVNAATDYAQNYAHKNQSPLSTDSNRLHKWHSFFVWVLQDKLRYYENFLCRGVQNAQDLIDVTQTMLDAEWVDGQFKSILEIALLRLAQIYQLYPRKILLNDVLHRNALIAYNNVAVKGTHNGKVVSVKVSGSRSESVIFRQHILMWTRLCHDNVLPMYGMCTIARYDDLGQYNGLGIVSPFMMSNIINFLKENPVVYRKFFILDVALGMSYLHDNGVVHGRLHGKNILIAHNPLRACLADFGLALVHPTGPRAALFLAPELNVSCPPYPPRTKASDVYAFSVTSYKILTSSDIEWSPWLNPSKPDDSEIDQLTWKIFLGSWQRSPDMRPTADQIVERLKEIIAPKKLCVERLKSVLNVVFNDSGYYKQFLSCTKVDAQEVLDTFQLLLDTSNFRLEDRNQLIVAMRRLSERAELYPTRFLLNLSPPTAEDVPITYGAFADVYKKNLPDHDICVKMIRVTISSLEGLAKMYAREVIVWSQLSHPNILPFYGLLKHGSRLCLISRWANNGNLNDYLKNNPTASRILLCLDMAAGVEYLHKNDIVHGDLKGVNVLIDNSGRACLGDFGLSSVTDPGILKWTSQSTEASSGGTVRWQAPELHNSRSVGNTVHNTKESDVFAWASTCYEAFTSQCPFYEIKNSRVAEAIEDGKKPTRPEEDDPAWSKHHLNDRIWRLLEDCWNFHPSERPNIKDIVSSLGVDKPTDYRPFDNLEERASMRFRMAHSHDKNLPKELSSLWEGLENLLLRIVPGAFER